MGITFKKKELKANTGLTAKLLHIYPQLFQNLSLLHQAS